MKRFIIFLIANQFLAIGIILNTRTHLGVAAFTSVFYALSKITHYSLGLCSFVLYFLLILIQIILSKKITLAYLLELPYSIVFSILTDIYDAIISYDASSPFNAILSFISGIYLTSWGVYLLVQCNLVVTPTDGIVKTISDVFHFPFGIVKNVFDITMIMICILICLMTSSPLYGIGIGTIISAIVLGRLISLHGKTCPMSKLLQAENSTH